MTNAPQQPVRKRRWIILAVALSVGVVLCVLLGYGLKQAREAASRMTDT